MEVSNLTSYSQRTHENRLSRHMNDLGNFQRRHKRRLVSGEDLLKIRGWKSLLLLQFEPQFLLAIHFGIVISFLACTVDAIYAVTNDRLAVEDQHLRRYLIDGMYVFDGFYFVELFLMLIYKSVKLQEIKYTYRERHGAILLMELLSLLPIEMAVNFTYRTYYLIRLRYTCRMIRLWLFLRQRNRVYDSVVAAVLIMKIVLALFFASIFATFILTPTISIIQQTYIDDLTLLTYLYTITGRITAKGFGEVSEDIVHTRLVQYLFGLLNIISFMLTSLYVSKTACSLIPHIKYRFIFVHNYMRITTYLGKWRRLSRRRSLSNFYRSYEQTISRYFRMSWQNKKTYTYKRVPSEKIPKVMVGEVSLDASLVALKHSHLFRDQDVHFLRSVAVQMTYRQFSAGELIYKKQSMKSCMIYVLSGIIQIISEENSETPIISLSGGTCIGETTLFIDYPSACTVMSKTHSETITLKKKHLAKIFRNYPTTCRELFRSVSHRYAQAVLYRKLFHHQKKKNKYHEDSGECLPVIYIKATLRRLLYDQKLEGKHKRRTQNKLKQFCFCPFYLDLLAITEEIELLADSVFIKKRFPFIFRNDSAILTAWDILVCAIAIFLVLVYPILLCLIEEQLAMVAFKYYCGTVTLFWSIDIYLRISTAVKTRHVFLTNISSILYYRLMTCTFLVDLWCVFPLGFLISLVRFDLSARYLFLLEIHKLFKVYRLKGLVEKLAQLNSRSLLILKYVKVLVYTFLLFYYSACTLYMLICQETCNKIYLSKISYYYNMRGNETLLIFLQLYTVASYFINDASVIDMLQSLTSRQRIIVFLMQIIYCSCYIYLLADTIAADTVNQQETHEFKEYVANIKTIMKKLEFDCSIQERVWSFLKHQYCLDKGTIFLNPKINRSALSKNLYILHQFIMYGHFFSKVPIFSHLDESILMEICKKANVIRYAPGQVITYSGEICKEMHLIASGQCKMVDRQGHAKLLRANDHFSTLELCADTPVVNTVITISDCEIISLNVNVYQNLIRKHWWLRLEIEKALELSKRRDSEFYYGDELVRIDPVPHKGKKLASIHCFRTQNKQSKNIGYRLGFGRYTRFLKYILMPITLTPYGRFLFYYEACRCVLVLITNFLCSSVIILKTGTFGYALLFLDILSWIDLYLMHHVCYFNKQGLEICHPMYTAKNYWRHSFLLDLISCLPIDYPFDAHSRWGFYLRLNRAFQIHRIASFFNYLNANNISRTGMFDILKYFPLSLLFINYVTLFFLDANCFVHAHQEVGKECAARLLVARKMHNATFSPMNMHASGLLLISSTLATIGMARFFLRQYSEMLYLDVLVLIAVVFTIWLTTKMVANNFYRNSDLTAYQQAMKELLTFFNYRKVDKNIKREIIEHYEHMWKRKQCKNVHRMIRYFSTCFREDLLYDVFGKALEESLLFPSADKSFFKSLLLEMEHVVLLKRAIIYRVNDVHDEIFFLLNGEVDVLGADFKKLLILTKGSLFGSLDDAPFMRQTLMMVARSNIELLCIKSSRYYYILSKYNRLHQHFRYLIIMHTDYLESSYEVEQKKRGKHHAAGANGEKGRAQRLYFKFNPIYKKNLMMRFWELLVSVLVCFLGFHLEISQKILWNHSAYVVIVLYIMDVMYWMKIYLKFHTAYEDNMGTIVMDREKIARQYIRSRLEFFVDVMSSIPLEVVCMAIRNPRWRMIVFACGRMNRIARIILICAKLKNACHKLYTNVTIMRLLQIFTLFTIYIHISSGFLVYLRSMLRVRGLDYADMLALYENTLLIVVYTTMGSSINNFTVTFNFVIAVYCVLVALIGRFLVSLFIAETCSIMVSVNKNKSDYKEFALQLRKFVDRKSISPPLKEQILDYIRLMWVYHKGVHFPALLETAPYYLREATLNAMFGCHLRQHPVLRNCHVDLIRQMAAEMRLVILFPGNCVVHKGDVDNCMYFIHEGAVDALSEDLLSCEVIEETLFAGDSFGLLQGIHPRHGHEYTYKVRQHSVILKLDRSKWHYKLGMFPASRQIIDEYLRTQIVHFI